ncbi:sigma-70 family RNA polymerase sigma factor [Psychromonas sp. 14N.309.X.WAT.B.A12]|uniref:sigma-70 family RNA polymerase sigma factor n=1 Tax=unclassified Psychromonas TaxID=2614957 RepID=UPI0025B250CB|nr:sigma-70 family RNA polymerase sigma factor [Psychromonas sp. 14N.309.X.WAT.B.A12]MDN2663625.1 sigma-70 family RNA polymerase sigma factor [Psychromonas sp. 14N.309.X.WAT.B.A12]
MSSSTGFDYEGVLQQCATGDRRALMQLYEQEASRLLTVVTRILKNQPLSEDVVHDAFIKIWKNADAYQQELGSARGWIYTLTRNLALNALKHTNRQVLAEPEFLLDLCDNQVLASAGQADDMTELAEDHLAQASLQTCLEHLEPERKLCVLHAYVDGYTQDEIAKLIDKPLGTVKSWIKRSLNALKECLQ